MKAFLFSSIYDTKKHTEYASKRNDKPKSKFTCSLLNASLFSIGMSDLYINVPQWPAKHKACFLRVQFNDIVRS